MRRAALACAGLVAALLLLLAGDRVARGRAAPPQVGWTDASDDLTPGGRNAGRAGPVGERGLAEVPAVDIRVGGVVLFRGERVGLASLGLACAKQKVVVLRVEDDASWCHVEWVLAALQAAGVRRIRFDLPDGTVESCFESDYWKQDARHLAGGHNAGLVLIGLEDLEDSDLAGHVAEDAARIKVKSGLQPLGMPYPYSWPPERSSFGLVARGLRALRDAGVEIELQFGWPEDGVPDVVPLPPPSDPPMSLAWPVEYRCSCEPGLIALDLPVADMAERDIGQEEDDRLLIQLGRGGIMRVRRSSYGASGGALTLDGLTEALRAAKDRYDLKMRQQGKAGFEKTEDGASWSKLYVLIRADRTAPACQIGWILQVLAEERFYKVQFAATKEPEEPLQGPCVGGLSGKIQAFLPVTGSGLISTDEPTFHVYVDRASFGLGSVGGLDAEELGSRMKAEYVPANIIGKTVVAVHVGRDVAWERVITAVNVCARVGLECVDFHGLPPPDEATRHASPLPR
ncbi:MAG TPA: hypothetical protein VFY93_13840 [Planctomycetota bacterium]|nr:hypothetical protein [Planctomycetota bacterium]